MYNNYRPNPYFNYDFPGQMKHGWPVDYQRSQPPIAYNQSYPFQSPTQNMNLNPYPHQNSYYQPPLQAYGQSFPSGYGSQPMMVQNQQMTPKDSQFLFQNPLQPQEEMVQNQYMPMNGYPMMNPYPKQNMVPKQPGGMQSFMNSFKSQDGSVDFNKMMNTAGQMMNAVNQVSSLVKGFGGFFKA
jgi:hypothetical protein